MRATDRQHHHLQHHHRRMPSGAPPSLPMSVPSDGGVVDAHHSTTATTTTTSNGVDVGGGDGSTAADVLAWLIDMRSTVVRTVLDFFDEFQSVLPAPVAAQFTASLHSPHLRVVLTLVLAYLLGVFDFHPVWIMLLVLWRVHALVREEGYIERRRVTEVLTAMETRDDFITYLMMNRASLIPTWVNWPDTERVAWLNRLLKLLWPYFLPGAHKRLQAKIDYELLIDRPPSLESIVTRRINLGAEPPRIEGVKVYSDLHTDAREILIDVQVNWTSDAELVLDVCLKNGLHLDVTCSHLVLGCILRVRFHPLVYVIPGFSNISISFVERPSIDFRLSALNTKLTNIPGLSTFLYNEAMSKVLKKVPVLPEQMTIPIGSFTTGRDVSVGAPQFLLHIRIYNCSGLDVQRLGQGRETLFVRCSLVPEPPYEESLDRASRPRRETSRVTTTSQPMWKEDVYVWVTNPTMQSLKMEVLHYNKLFKNVALGYVGVQLDELSTDIQEEYRALIDAPGRIRFAVALYPLVNDALPSSDDDDGLGSSSSLSSSSSSSSSMSSSHVPFGAIDRDRPSTGSGNNLLGRKNGVVVVDTSKPKELERLLRPPSLSLKERHLRRPKGCLLVRLHRLSHLIVADTFSSDPYVIITCGDEQFQTKPQFSTLNPVFNLTLPITIFDPANDTVVVQVVDYDRVGKHDPLGDIAFSFERLAEDPRASMCGPSEYPLFNTTRGTIEIDFVYRPLADWLHEEADEAIDGQQQQHMQQHHAHQRGRSPARHGTFGGTPRDARSPVRYPHVGPSANGVAVAAAASYANPMLQRMQGHHHLNAQVADAHDSHGSNTPPSLHEPASASDHTHHRRGQSFGSRMLATTLSIFRPSASATIRDGGGDSLASPALPAQPGSSGGSSRSCSTSDDVAARNAGSLDLPSGALWSPFVSPSPAPPLVGVSPVPGVHPRRARSLSFDAETEDGTLALQAGQSPTPASAAPHEAVRSTSDLPQHVYAARGDKPSLGHVTTMQEEKRGDANETDGHSPSTPPTGNRGIASRVRALFRSPSSSSPSASPSSSFSGSVAAAASSSASPSPIVRGAHVAAVTHDRARRSVPVLEAPYGEPLAVDPSPRAQVQGIFVIPPPAVP